MASWLSGVSWGKGSSLAGFSNFSRSPILFGGLKSLRAAMDTGTANMAESRVLSHPRHAQLSDSLDVVRVLNLRLKFDIDSVVMQGKPFGLSSFWISFDEHRAVGGIF